MVDSVRDRAPSLDELKAVAQPPEVRSRKNAEYWTAELYLPHVSIYFPQSSCAPPSLPMT